MEHFISYFVGCFLGALIGNYIWEKWLKDILFKKAE